MRCDSLAGDASGSFEAFEGVCARRIDVDSDAVAGGEVSGEDALRQGVLDSTLDGAAQGASTVGRVVAFLHQCGACRLGDFEVDVAFGQARAHLVQEQVGDHCELGLGERLEDDDLVDAVEELGAEGLLQCVLDVAAS